MKNDLGMLITFQEADASKFTMVGGKGANLGELCKIDGIHVPEGFCISTDVLNRMMDETSSMKTFLDQLSRLKAEDSAKISELSHEIRRVIEGKPIPEDVIEEISGFLSKFWRGRSLCNTIQLNRRRSSECLFCRAAGYLLEYCRKERDTQTRQQVLGVALY